MAHKNNKPYLLKNDPWIHDSNLIFPMRCSSGWRMSSWNWKLKNKVGAHQGEHCPTRTTHSFGTRVRRFDTRLGIVFLLVPKLRKGSSILFFVTEKKRSEQALLQVVQEALIN